MWTEFLPSQLAQLDAPGDLGSPHAQCEITWLIDDLSSSYLDSGDRGLEMMLRCA
jgi:hypothetical protein